MHRGKNDTTVQTWEVTGSGGTERETETLTAQSAPESRPKRGKYVSRACQYCHNRKIKCDGEDPCRPCSAKKRRCVRDHRGSTTSGNRKRPNESIESPSDEEFEQYPVRSKNQGGTPGEDRIDIQTSTANILLDKIANLQAQITRLADMASLRHTDMATAAVDSRRAGSQVSHKGETRLGHYRHGSNAQSDVPQNESVAEPDFENPMSCFRVLGETSINQTLQQVENSLESPRSDMPGSNMPLQIQAAPSCSASHKSGSDSAPMQKVLMEKLQYHDLQPSKEGWDDLFDNYCEFVYPLFPFPHIPSLRMAYARLWKGLSQGSWGAQTSPSPTVDEMAQVLICLALGRCTTSVRDQATEAPYSAGWKFYSAAVDLLGSLLDPMGEGSPRIVRLQSLTLMLVYLIRLDANELAQKILAVAAIQAQQLGLHREQALQSLPIFVSEAARRVWHTIYVIDRRLALDVGRPFLLQDHNIDSKLPLNVTDEWLEEHRTSEEFMETLGNEMTCQNADDKNTPIGYLSAMVGYSQLVGKIWDTLYQANAPDSGCGSSFLETFEARISLWCSSLPPSLRSDDDNAHLVPTGLTPWQVRLRFLVYVRTNWLRILARKPLRRQTTTAGWMQDFDDSKAIELAASIVTLLSRVLEPYQMYQFPFLQYLFGAASIILGIIIKVPGFRRRYSDSIVRAAHQIRVFSRKTWISGKMARSITRFTHVAARVVGNIEWKDTTLETSPHQPPQAIKRTQTHSQSKRVRSSADAAYRTCASNSTSASSTPLPSNLAVQGLGVTNSNGDVHALNRREGALERSDDYNRWSGQALATNNDTLPSEDDTTMWHLAISDFAFETGFSVDMDYLSRPRENAHMGWIGTDQDAFDLSGVEYDANALFDMSYTS